MRLILLLSLFAIDVHAQLLPGFNGTEYRELMLISARTVDDSTYASQFPEPLNFKMVYRSTPIGLDNQWDLWLDQTRDRAVISIRGTTLKPDSWLENFYAAMIPASDTIYWNEGGNQRTIPYQLADHPRASVHSGWTLGMLLLSEDILPKVTELLEQNEIEDFYIVGHSQGGAIAYLLNAHFHYLQKNNILPNRLTFKTYCSAAPKPGNLYFAYDFESYTQGGWAFNVVNSADWVPEVPFSVQTLEDFNTVSPFSRIDDLLAEQSLIDRIGLWWIIRKIDRPTTKAQENFEKYLGEKVNASVTSKVDGLLMPNYASTNNYVRTGQQVVLTPNAEYNLFFPADSSNVFIHHGHKAYLHLLRVHLINQSSRLNQLPLDTTFRVTKILDADGELHQLPRNTETQFGFFSNGHAGGKDGCNSFGAAVTVDRNTITWEEGFTMTLLYCENTLDEIFQSTLREIETFKVKEHELILYKNGVPRIWLALD